MSSEIRKRRKREKVTHPFMTLEDSFSHQDLSSERRDQLEYAARLKKRVAQIHNYPDGNE